MCTTDHVQKAFREKRGGGGGETRGDQVQARPTPLLRLLPVRKEAHQGTQLGAPSPLLNVSLHLEWPPNHGQSHQRYIQRRVGIGEASSMSGLEAG